MDDEFSSRYSNYKLPVSAELTPKINGIQVFDGTNIFHSVSPVDATKYREQRDSKNLLYRDVIGVFFTKKHQNY